MQLYSEDWRRNWCATRMTPAEFEFFGKSMAQFAVPEMLLATDIDGTPVGYSLTLPDIDYEKPLAGLQ